MCCVRTFCEFYQVKLLGEDLAAMELLGRHDVWVALRRIRRGRQLRPDGEQLMVQLISRGSQGKAGE